MGKIIRIGTRESQLAIWQATQVKELLAGHGIESQLIFIKSEGDIDLVTPLYEIGVQGIFTRSLDAALLSGRIDLAVHSMKDVPTQLPQNIVQAAVLKRGPVNDLLVFKNEEAENSYSLLLNTRHPIATERPLVIATSSVRRKAQWLNKFPDHEIHNLRGNINTRLKKLQEEVWDGAIFAQAGLERISLRPKNSIVLDWMLPAPAQGAIMVVCREDDEFSLDACSKFNDTETALCTKIERDFLRQLLGGCSTPISGYAEISHDTVHFRGNILSPDGSKKLEVEGSSAIYTSNDLGIRAAVNILQKGGLELTQEIRHAAN